MPPQEFCALERFYAPALRTPAAHLVGNPCTWMAKFGAFSAMCNATGTCPVSSNPPGAERRLADEMRGGVVAAFGERAGDPVRHPVTFAGGDQRDDAATEAATGHPGPQRPCLASGFHSQIDGRDRDLEVVPHGGMGG